MGFNLSNMNKNKYTIILSTKSKIVSINSLYAVKIVYVAGHPRPQMYKTAAAHKFQQEALDELRALKMTEEDIKWFESTKSFKVTVQFVLRSGISRKDVSNLDKLLLDTIVKYVRDDLGVSTFDDSLFGEVHFYKSELPKSSNEYCIINITESNHNLRYDITPKPGRVWFYNTELKPTIPPLPKRKKRGVNYVEEVGEEGLCDCSVYIFGPDYEFGPETVKDLTRSIDRASYSGSGFVYLGFIGTDEDWKGVEYRPILSDLAEEISKLGPQGKCGFISSPQDISEWWK